MDYKKETALKAASRKFLICVAQPDQPLVWTTGALPLPTGALPLPQHPARPKARTT